MRASDLNLKNPTFRSLARLSELLPFVHAPMLCTIGVGQTKLRQFSLVKKYGLLIKHEVHKQAEKEQGQYLAILTEQSWLIKDLPYGKRISVLAGHSGKSLAGKTAASCPLTQLPI